MSDERDHYSRFDYRRMVAWPERIEREWRFLEPILRAAPSSRVLDLGSGTGEHARFLASKGFDVVGIDSSATMVEKSVEPGVTDRVRFIHGSIAEVDSLVDETQGGAICLGNTLPHLGRDEIATLVRGLASLFLPGAPLVIQILNYERIVSSGERHLPLNFRPNPEGDGAIVFLRLMDPREDGTVIFMPTTIEMKPGEEEPVRVVSSKRVELHGWRIDELGALLSANGFARIEAFGGFDGSPFDAKESRDLILVAWKG